MIWGAHAFTYEEQREYLHACFRDKYALVQERILLGQPVDFKDEEGRSAMYLAAIEGNSDIVKFLLENKGELMSIILPGCLCLCLSFYFALHRSTPLCLAHPQRSRIFPSQSRLHPQGNGLERPALGCAQRFQGVHEGSDQVWRLY